MQAKQLQEAIISRQNTDDAVNEKPRYGEADKQEQPKKFQPNRSLAAQYAGDACAQ